MRVRHRCAPAHSDILTLKYADECFVLTVHYIETFVTNAALDLKPDRTVMLRFRAQA